MAAYLVLKHKKTGVIYQGKDLIKVDAMLCKAINVDYDERQWCRGWMNWLGFSMALGNKIDKSFYGPESVEIVEWFEKTFDNVSYFSR